jgi:uncharacterized protein (UPF0332 family)
LNAEQMALIAKAEEGLRAAQLLIGQRFVGPAVSEAYYVMFNAAKALLIQKGLRRHKHGAVIAAIGEHFAKPGLIETELHRWIIAAEKDRLTADYSVSGQVTSDAAHRHIENAKAFLEQVKSFLEGSAG